MTITCTWAEAQNVCFGRYGDIVYVATATEVTKFGTERGNLYVLNPNVAIAAFLAVWPNAKEVTNISA